MVDINQKDRTVRIKIVYYGPAVCGKTTNLRVLHERALWSRRGEFISVDSLQDRTILCDLLPLRTGGFRGYDLRLQLLAVPGQAVYATTRRVVLKAADGVVFVANSAADRQSENAISYREMIANLIGHQLDPHTIPLVVQYNKSDLPQVEEPGVMERALNPRHVPSFSAVATKGTGVLETFTAILSATLAELCRRYRTLELPPGQSVEAWTRQAIDGMFGRERFDAPPAEESPAEAADAVVEIELADGTIVPMGEPAARHVRIPAGNNPVAPVLPETPVAPPPAVPAAAAAPVAPAVPATPSASIPSDRAPDALSASYAEASAELSIVVGDLREERDAALARLEEMRRAIELATEAPGGRDIESRVRRILNVLVGAGGATCAALRLSAGEANRLLTLPPLESDPLSRTPWGDKHLDNLHDLAEPMLEQAFDSAGLTDALRAGEPSFDAVVLVPLRSAERLLGLALLYYDLHAVLPSHDTMAHLGFLARELAGPLEAAAARATASAAQRLRVQSHASAAAVASLLARLPQDAVRRQRLDLAEVLGPLRVTGVSVEVAAQTLFVLGDAPLLRFALASLVQQCEADALERGHAPETVIQGARDETTVRLRVNASGATGVSILSPDSPGAAAFEAELSVVQTVVALHGGVLSQEGDPEHPLRFTLELDAA